MIMDSGDEIYVWVGSGAQPEEKAQGLAIAKVISSLILYLSKIYDKITCNLCIFFHRAI